MINAKLILSVALALTTSLAGASAATNVENSDTDIRSAISAQQEERLSAKLESGKITQEKYDEIIAAIESGEFRGAWGKNAMRGNRGNIELTEEQKAEFSEKRAEMLAEKLEAGEITQEQYDEIIAAIESGEFRGVCGNNAMRGNRGNAAELTEEQKAEFSEKRAEMFAEKQAEAAENGGFGAFKGGMRGNFGARNK